MTKLPDRSHIASEQRHPASVGMDQKSVSEILTLFELANEEACHAVRAARSSIAGFIGNCLSGFHRGGRLIYCGAGTSGRLGVLDASEVPPTFCMDSDRVIGLIAGGDSALRKSSEGAEDDSEGFIQQLEALQINADDSLLGIAAGGTTPIVRGALSWAAEREVHTCLLSCVPIDPPHPRCGLIIANTGAELLTGSTRLKAGTATKLILNAISTTIMIKSGRVFDNIMIDVKARNDKLRDRAIRLMQICCPDFDREHAQQALEGADWSVKLATVMHQHDLDRPAAEALIAKTPYSVPLAPLPSNDITIPKGWQPAAGGGMQRSWSCNSYREAQAFINKLADIAEEQNHHPDISWSYAKVTVRLCTHDAGNKLTELDIAFAKSLSSA